MLQRLGRNAHHQQRRNHRDVADTIHEEAPALIGCGDEHSRQRRTDQARQVHHGGIDGDGVGEIGAFFDHPNHERLPARHVESIDHSLHRAESEHFTDGDAVGQREPCQRE